MRNAPTTKNSDGEPVILHGGELPDLQRDRLEIVVSPARPGIAVRNAFAGADTEFIAATVRRDVLEQFVAACKRTVDMVGRSRVAHREGAGQLAVVARRRNRVRRAVTVFGVHFISIEM